MSFGTPRFFGFKLYLHLHPSEYNHIQFSHSVPCFSVNEEYFDVFPDFQLLLRQVVQELDGAEVLRGPLQRQQRQVRVRHLRQKVPGNGEGPFDQRQVAGLGKILLKVSKLRY